MRATIALVILVVGLQAAMAAESECEGLNIAGGTAVKTDGASGGEAVRIALGDAKNGPVAVLPLPEGTKPGKYEVTLRLKFDPPDMYAEALAIGVGESRRRFRATDHPDPQASDWRLWTMPVIIADPKAGITVSRERGWYQADGKAAAVLLDRLGLRRLGDEVFLVSGRSKKILYEPGEEAVFDVRLRNIGGERATRTVRATEISDLDKRLPLGIQKVEIGPGAEAVARFAWKLGPEEYGREVRVELLGQGDAVLDETVNYFHVADNMWKVLMPAPGIPHMTHPDSTYCPGDARTPEGWQKYLEDYVKRMHAEYGTCQEWFAWAPDDVFYMTPTEESWISGQGCYQHLRSRLLDLSRVNRELGVRTISYAKSAASGPPCYEFYRRNPQFGEGRFHAQFDQQMVRDWDTQIPGRHDSIFYTWLSTVVDVTRPGLVDAAINEILDSADMFGFAGARYDDHYTHWGKPSDEISNRNMSRIFELGRKRNPKFIWGFNYIATWTTCIWPGGPKPDVPWQQKSRDASLPPDPREPSFDKMPEPWGELKIACENGAYIMNEQIREAGERTYTYYARSLAHEARYVRELGGHYGPIGFNAGPRSAFDEIYPELLCAATRSHAVYGMRADMNFKQFLTRYSTFIYGTALESILDPESVLKVDGAPGLWWHLFAYTWKQAGKERVLVHLLSAPKNDTRNQNLSGIVDKATDVSVAYTAPGEVTGAWELSPYIEGFCRPLKIEGNTVRPPDFHLWKTVVFELKGGAR